MGQWLDRNLPCFECGSSDAMQESEFHYKCFSCGKTFKKRDRGEEITEVISTGFTMQKKVDLIEPGNFHELKKRGLKLETCQKYNITTTRFSGTFGFGAKAHYVNNEWVYIFNYSKNGVIQKQKIRLAKDKEFTQKGNMEFKELYGQSLFRPDITRPIIITEGEFDAASVWQATGMNCVSITSGAGSALTEIKNNIDYLSGFKYVVIAFDNDDEGQKATQKIVGANLFEPGKLRITHWGKKDANDYLQAGEDIEIKKLIWDAEEYRPNDLFTAKDLIDLALVKPIPGADTPWPALSQSIQGWRPNTINVIAAADGIGKTEVADEIIHKFIMDNNKVWLYSCEQEATETMIRQAGKTLHIPLHIPGIEWDEEQIRSTIDTLEGKLVVWKPEKSASVDELIERMKYATIAYNIKYFIIDHLKAIESQMTDPNAHMNRFLSELKFFAKKYNSCIILMAHVAKDKKQGRVGTSDESWNRGRIPTKENIHGSSAISAWSDVVITLARNVEAENSEEACITKLSVLKKRLMGIRGRSLIYLRYLPDTGRLIEQEPIDYEEETEKSIDD